MLSPLAISVTFSLLTASLRFRGSRRCSNIQPMHFDIMTFRSYFRLTSSYFDLDVRFCSSSLHLLLMFLDPFVSSRVSFRLPSSIPGLAQLSPYLVSLLRLLAFAHHPRYLDSRSRCTALCGSPLPLSDCLLLLLLVWYLCLFTLSCVMRPFVCLHILLHPSPILRPAFFLLLYCLFSRPYFPFVCPRSAPLTSRFPFYSLSFGPSAFVGGPRRLLPVGGICLRPLSATLVCL